MTLFSVFPIKLPETHLCCAIQEVEYIIKTQLPHRVALYVAFMGLRKVARSLNSWLHINRNVCIMLKGFSVFADKCFTGAHICIQPAG